MSSVITNLWRNEMNLKFDKHDGNILLCPHCDNDYLHHEGVEIYNRKEDATADRISVSTCNEHNKYELNIDQGGKNPSGRRDGIRVFFSCESCGQASALTITQHKGQTFMEWEA